MRHFNYTAKQAQEKQVFVINYRGLIEKTSLFEHVMESATEVTSPRGVAPKLFIEQIEIFGENESETFELRRWEGSKYRVVNSYQTYEEAEQELFETIYEVDYTNDDSRNCNWFETESEALSDLAEPFTYELNLSSETALSVAKKTQILIKNNRI